MTRAAALDPPAPTPGRSPGDGFGMAVFVAWLVLAVSGFWNLIVLPMQARAAQANDPVQRAAVEHWARSALGAQAPPRGIASPDGRPDVARDAAMPISAPIVLVDPVACGCVASAAVSLAERLRAGGVAVVDLPRDATRIAQRPEVAVLDGDGRLRYAGPAMPALFCTSGRSLAESAVHAGAAGSAALVLPAECRCDDTVTLR